MASNMANLENFDDRSQKAPASTESLGSGLANADFNVMFRKATSDSGDKASFLPAGDDLLKQIGSGAGNEAPNCHELPGQNEPSDLDDLTKTIDKIINEANERQRQIAEKALLDPDVSKVVSTQDGLIATVIVEKNDGTLITYKPDGTKVTESPDGTKVVEYPEGADPGFTPVLPDAPLPPVRMPDFPMPDDGRR